MPAHIELNGRLHEGLAGRSLIVAGGLLAAAALILALAGQPREPFPVVAAVGTALLLLSIEDLRRFTLPDVLTLSLAAGGLMWGASGGGDLGKRILGVAAGYLSIMAIASAYRLLRGREGIGHGDAKLLAAAGAWTGWGGLPAIIVVAAVGALAASGAGALIERLSGRQISIRSDTPVPFGTFIAAGFWVLWTLRPPLQGTPW